MLNFAEQTGSGAVIVVWSFLSRSTHLYYMNSSNSVILWMQQHGTSGNIGHKIRRVPHPCHQENMTKYMNFLVLVFHWLLSASKSDAFESSLWKRGQCGTAQQRLNIAALQSTRDDEDSSATIRRRESLKRDLLALAASYDRGFGASPSARRRGDDVISALEALNEETNAARGVDGSEASPLAGSWRMVWTTASDVLVLGASPVATVGAIYQIFDPLPVVTNVIDFIPRIQALLPPSIVPSTLVRAKVQTKASLRPGFSNRVGLWFEAVNLQPVQVLGMDATSLPPFAANLPKLPGTDGNNESGPGYFDVTYLDDELLIIQQNSPGGLFALVKVQDSDP
jgi:PAP_fibrillin